MYRKKSTFLVDLLVFHQPEICVTLVKSHLPLRKQERKCSIKLNVILLFSHIAYVNCILRGRGAEQPLIHLCLYFVLLIIHRARAEHGRLHQITRVWIRRDTRCHCKIAKAILQCGTTLFTMWDASQLKL